ncbi:Hypothetical predicted protein [Olea europaea subsp. europaea]|uniref:Uncharacterized protein n=1 Tax=Olea europaea subsp. europaea TaxID=158383 RepID=A0A8S0Q715_OLEEU|nr:Hypothetical predicted protein [Olea europaea subsp. europaea]
MTLSITLNKVKDQTISISISIQFQMQRILKDLKVNHLKDIEDQTAVIIKTFNLSKMLIEQETLKSILIWTEENQKASRRWTKGVLLCVLQEHTPDDACMPYWKFQNLFYIMHHGLIECQKIIYMGDFQFEILKASMLHQLLCTILVVEDKQFGMLIDREFLL